MISRTETRKELRKALSKLKETGKDYTYPMSDFRHAIMNCVDKCKLIKGCKWYLNPEKKFCCCTLFFKTMFVECEYDYTTKVVDIREYNYACGNIIMTRAAESSCEYLPLHIYEWQPKIKVVRKKQ